MNRRGVLGGLVVVLLAFAGLGVPAASAASPLTVDPTTYDFGTLAVGENYDFSQDYVTVTNDGAEQVTLDSIDLAGSDATEFGIYEFSNCSVGSVIDAGQSCYLDLTFAPETAGTKTAEVTIAPDAGDPVTVQLRGAGSVGQGNSPTFAPATISPSTEGEVSSVASGDVDGDGLDDVLSTIFSSPVSLGVFPAGADTTLGTPATFDVSDGFSGNVKTGYLNDDAYLDAVASASGVARVFLNDGTGTMEMDVDLATDDLAPIQTIGDFNDDGHEDVVVSDVGDSVDDPGEYTGYLDFYPGDGDGGFGARIRTDIGDQSLFDMVTSDFDGDGKDDDLAYTTDDRGRPVMMRGNGDGTFTRVTVTGGSDCGCGQPWGIASSDLNGDGRDDITATLRYNDAVESFVSKDDGTFDRSQVFRLPLPPSGYNTNPKGLDSKDLNGDGVPDAVTADYMSGTVSWLTGNGDGTYSFAGNQVLEDASGPNVAVIGQFGSGVKPDISIGDQGTGSASVYTLANTGNPGQVPSPSSLTFGPTASGYVSDPETVEITNQDGIAPLEIKLVQIAGDYSSDFVVQDASDCLDRVVLVGKSCSIQVAFKPVGPPGPRDSTLYIDTNNDEETQIQVPLSGTAASDVPSGSVSPDSLDFGSVPVGSAGPTTSFTITNDGYVPLETSATTVEGPDAGDFTADNGCAAKTLAVGASCAVGVGFAPTETGQRSASVRVASEFGDFVVPVGGSGTEALRPGIAVQPESLSFANTRVGSVSADRSITVTSTGTAPLVIAGVSTSGGNAPDFQVVSENCSGAVQPGGTCAVQIRFTPTATGVRTASLEISSDAAGSPSSVSLSGTGIPKPTPKVTFKKKPRKKYLIRGEKLKQVKVAFKSSLAGSRFQCRIDRRKFAGCKSPKVFRKIKPGKHTIRVRAIKAGKTGPAKAVTFKVIRRR